MHVDLHLPEAPPEPGLREKKKRATRQAIVDAATELFLREGLQRTTIDEIAAVAGVARRTFFLHFASKEDVLFHHVERYGDAAATAIELLPPDATAWHGVQTAVATLVDLFDSPHDGSDTLASVRAQTVHEGHGLPASLSLRLVRMQSSLLEALGARFPDADTTIVAAHLGAALGAVAAVAVCIMEPGSDEQHKGAKEAMLGALDRAGAGFAPDTRAAGRPPGAMVTS